ESAASSDDDRPRAGDKERFEVVSQWHGWTLALGLGGLVGPGSGHEVDEAIEQIARIVRAGRGLGVELDGEGRDVEAGQTLDDIVVEAHVGDDDTTVVGLERRGRLALERGVDGEAVVLRGDLDLL